MSVPFSTPATFRLSGYDYSTPSFYMVSFSRAKGLADFSALPLPPPPSTSTPSSYCISNSITRSFVRIIRHFHEAFPEIAPITTFTVMPDHLHLLIRILDLPFRHSLPVIVDALKESLTAAYRREAPFGRSAPRVFIPGFHDWIVKRRGQLAAFTRYIRDNPRRACLRVLNRRFFNRIHRVSFLDRTWYAYGNTALLQLPEIVPLKGHRSTSPGTPEWEALLAKARRIGPGGAGVSTFMSAHEKACGHALGLAGGAWIVLQPEGFVPSVASPDYAASEGVPTKWHPSARQEKACAEGRLLFLTLWEGRPGQLDKRTLYARCHEMGDAVAACAPRAQAPLAHPSANVL